MRTSNKLFCLLVVFIFSINITAQQILLDKPIRAGELILFPALDNGSNYYYLPDKPRLAKHDNNTPQFSFLRYVKNEKTAADSNSAITESGFGGGIVHALVELNVSDAQIEEAEQSLKRIDRKGEIVGPVIFKSGNVALVSSVAKEGGEFTQQVVGLGSAPILENQKSAVSVQLNQLGSKILWETFNTPTPDFSIYFEMEVEGYMSPKRVTIKADYERIYNHKTMEAALVTPVLSGEIKIAMNELYDSGAITVTQVGDDDELNKLKETAYNQLISLLFDKIGGTGIPQLNQLNVGKQKSMLDRATNMLDKARKEAKEENKKVAAAQTKKTQAQQKTRTKAVTRSNTKRTSKKLNKITPPKGKQSKAVATTTKKPTETSTKTEKTPVAKKQALPSISVAFSYQMKKEKRKGSYEINLNKYTQTTRSMNFTYNLGNVQEICASCFREINLDDDLMKQREINASLGGIISDDFNYVNFVNVIMRKKHQDGSETVDEVKIDRSSFNLTGNFYKMMYGWKGDSNRDEWLSYDYKTQWSVFGNHSFESEWISTKFGSISLEPPVIKKPIYIEVDRDFVIEEGIKAAEIKLFSIVNGKQTTVSANLKAKDGELTKTMEIILPRDVDNYKYEITYFIKGKDPVKSPIKDSNYGRIDVDRFYN